MSGLRINTSMHEPLLGDEEAGFAPRAMPSSQPVRPGRHIYFTYKARLGTCANHVVTVHTIESRHKKLWWARVHLWCQAMW